MVKYSATHLTLLVRDPSSVQYGYTGGKDRRRVSTSSLCAKMTTQKYPWCGRSRLVLVMSATELRAPWVERVMSSRASWSLSQVPGSQAANFSSLALYSSPSTNHVLSMNCQSSYFWSLRSHAFKSPAKNFLEPSESLCESHDDLQLWDTAPGRRSWGHSPLFMVIAWIHFKRLMKPKLIWHDVGIQFHCFLPRVTCCVSSRLVWLSLPCQSHWSLIILLYNYPTCFPSLCCQFVCVGSVFVPRDSSAFLLVFPALYWLCTLLLYQFLFFSACFLLFHHLPDWRLLLGPCFATTKAPKNDRKCIWVVVVCSLAHLLPCSWLDFMTIVYNSLQVEVIRNEPRYDLTVFFQERLSFITLVGNCQVTQFTANDSSRCLCADRPTNMKLRNNQADITAHSSSTLWI